MPVVATDLASDHLQVGAAVQIWTRRPALTRLLANGLVSGAHDAKTDRIWATTDFTLDNQCTYSFLQIGDFTRRMGRRPETDFPRQGYVVATSSDPANG